MPIAPSLSIGLADGGGRHLARAASHWFAGHGGATAIEVYSERLAAKGDPMIRLFDPNGHEVDYADDDDVRGSDAASCMKPHTGSYLLSCVMYNIAVVNRIACGSAVSNSGRLDSAAQHSDRKGTQRSGRPGYVLQFGTDLVWSH